MKTLFPLPIIFFLLLLLSLSANAQTADNQLCKSFSTSQEVKQVVDFLSKDKMQSPIWPDFKISSVPVVVTNLEKANRCYTLIEDGQITGIYLLTNPVKIENGLYEFMLPDRINLFKELFSEIKWTLFVGVVLDLSPKILSLAKDVIRTPGQQALFEHFYSSGIFALHVVTHEWFHVFMGSDIANLHHWPSWVGQADRKLTEKCYSLTPSIASLAEKEANALISAYTAQNRNDSLVLLKKYLSIRAERYALLKTYKIRTGDSFQTCHEGEVKMELNEGAADFIGLATLKSVGEIDDQGISEYLKNNFNNSGYYQIGAAKMLVIQKMTGPRFMMAVRAILEAKSWSESTDKILAQIMTQP